MVGQYVSFNGETLDSWSLTKQKVVLISSTKSKYMDFTNLAFEIAWTLSLLELKLPLSRKHILLWDNLNSNELTPNPIMDAKYIKIDVHCIRDQMLQN